MEKSKKVTVNDDILLYALRYSFSRNTTAPVHVINAIAQNIGSISNANIEKIIKDIEAASDVGFEMYQELWKGLVNDLKLELKIRVAKL